MGENSSGAIVGDPASPYKTQAKGNGGMVGSGLVVSDGALVGVVCGLGVCVGYRGWLRCGVCVPLILLRAVQMNVRIDGKMVSGQGVVTNVQRMILSFLSRRAMGHAQEAIRGMDIEGFSGFIANRQ